MDAKRSGDSIVTGTALGLVFPIILFHACFNKFSFAHAIGRDINNTTYTIFFNILGPDILKLN